MAVDVKRRAATDGASRECIDRGADDGGGDERVGVDEDQDVAGRGARAGVSHARDLAMVAVDDAHAMGAGDAGRVVGGGVVGDDDLVRLCDVASCRMDRVKRCADQPFFVVGRNDERNHPFTRSPDHQLTRFSR